jgi:hypothetical protein
MKFLLLAVLAIMAVSSYADVPSAAIDDEEQHMQEYYFK